MNKPNNKINKETGNFICNKCRRKIIIGVVIKGDIYCVKCSEIIKGIRDENGQLKGVNNV